MVCSLLLLAVAWLGSRLAHSEQCLLSSSPAYGQWKDRRVDHLLGSPAKPTGKYVITVHTKEAAAENGIRSRKAGREKEKASKNSRRCCFQNTGKLLTCSKVLQALCECCALTKPERSQAQAYHLVHSLFVRASMKTCKLRWVQTDLWCTSDWRHYEMPHKCHRRRLQMKVRAIATTSSPLAPGA